jgi:hypothetical protein
VETTESKIQWFRWQSNQTIVGTHLLFPLNRDYDDNANSFYLFATQAVTKSKHIWKNEKESSETVFSIKTAISEIFNPKKRTLCVAHPRLCRATGVAL